MKDPRLNKLAKLLVHYSIKLKEKEKVLIILYGMEGFPLLKEVYKECVKAGAYCTYELRESELTRVFFENALAYQIDKKPDKHRINQAKDLDAMIQILADSNEAELMHINQQKMVRQRKVNKAFSDIVHKKRWVLLEYPTINGAINAQMSTEEWEDFVFKSCLIDWEKIGEEQEILKTTLSQGKEITIIAEQTNLKLSIEKQPWIKCNGTHNMPDGEIFTSPLKNSLNGEILFNTPTSYMGKNFDWIKLYFEQGKIIKFNSTNNKDLEQILNVDEGSRYIGEFAFGTNKMIKKPVKSILFDEKIGGSNHFAIGKCYDEAPNGNDSSIHWDLIIRHKQASGKVYLDGELLQENGLWKHSKLTQFN